MLAETKARAVAADHPGSVVIGADQLLEYDRRLLHKVDDMAAARRQLRELRGRTHSLHSGIALVQHDQVVWSSVETATLTMRDFSDDELDTTLALEGNAVLASVGCYRLEGPSIRLFERIRGDYFTILGLPLLPLLSALRQFAPDLL